MEELFNKKILFDNISKLLEESNLKIGELEVQAGVSPGYISRTKDGNSKPGIDFILNVSKLLKTSVDILLNVDLKKLSPTESYLLSFIEKLTNDTLQDKLYWNIETPDDLNRISCNDNGYVEHPLFSLEEFYEKGMSDYSGLVKRIVFPSKSFGCNTFITDNCFNLRLKNGTDLYVMSISKNICKSNDLHSKAIEIWMSPLCGNPKFICSNIDNSKLSIFVDNLYTSLNEYSKHPKIEKNLKYVIDAFMNDDLEDDTLDSTDLPF